MSMNAKYPINFAFVFMVAVYEKEFIGVNIFRRYIYKFCI